MSRSKDDPYTIAALTYRQQAPPAISPRATVLRDFWLELSLSYKHPGLGSTMHERLHVVSVVTIPSTYATVDINT